MGDAAVQSYMTMSLEDFLVWPGDDTDRRYQPYMTMSLEDFLVWPGDGTDRRYQLIDGIPVAMAPTSKSHGIIQANLTFAIISHLKAANSRCRVVTAPGVVPKLHFRENFRIPDLGVTCSPDVRGQSIVTDPILLAEILSPSNIFATWFNVRSYTTIPSLREIVVLHSTKIEGYVLLRQADGTWPNEPDVFGREDSLPLDSIALNLPLLQAYEGTHLI